MLKKWNQSMGNEKSTAYLMVFPTAVIITLLGIVPILYVVWLSLCKVNPVTMETEFAGLHGDHILFYDRIHCAAAFSGSVRGASAESGFQGEVAGQDIVYTALGSPDPGKRESVEMDAEYLIWDHQ